MDGHADRLRDLAARRAAVGCRAGGHHDRGFPALRLGRAKRVPRLLQLRLGRGIAEAQAVVRVAGSRQVKGDLALQELLGDPLDVCSVHLALVRLHDVADQPAHLLGVGDLEDVEALADQRAQRRFVHALGQVALDELDLEAELRRVRGSALTHLLELRQRLLELLAIGADDVQDESVVDGPGKALRGPPLADLRLDHTHHVGGRRVLLLDRFRQRVVELLLEWHESPLNLSRCSARTAEPQPRDVLRLALPEIARLARRGPSPATCYGSHYYCTRNRGSRTSRRPSPRRFRARPESVSARPGKRLTQNASRMTFLPLAMTLPHDGTYGGTPTPRKPRIASASTAYAKMNVP